MYLTTLAKSLSVTFVLLDFWFSCHSVIAFLIFIHFTLNITSEFVYSTSDITCFKRSKTLLCTLYIAVNHMQASYDIIDYILDYITGRINYCYTKSRLFLDVRRDDH